MPQPSRRSLVEKSSLQVLLTNFSDPKVYITSTGILENLFIILQIELLTRLEILLGIK